MERVSLKVQAVILAVLGIVIFFGGVRYHQARLAAVRLETAAGIEEKEAQKAQTEKEPRLFCVHVVGAVKNAGVYTLDESKRVRDAVEMAEPLAAADLSQINLALPLEDGKQIYIPSKGEKKRERSTYAAAAQEDGLININSASAAELDKLPGIGPALAQRIIDYRGENGEFAKPEDITKVSGIGPALYTKLKDKIRVN